MEILFLAIVKYLKELELGRLYISEPNIESLPPMLEVENVVILTGAEAVAKADIVLLLVDHHTFKSISVADLADKVVIDTRGIWAVQI